MDFSLLNENSFWAVPLVVAITEVFKMSGFNTKFAPMISLVMGLAMSFLVNMDSGISQIIISGIVYGLSASGLYSSVKTTSNIRGVVPLRTNKEAVVVEQIEVEKPLAQSTVTANEEIQVTETMDVATNQQQTPTVQPKPQPQSQTEKPIIDKPVDTINNVEELNVEINEQDKNKF
jgi:hypothetical protein